ncbi:hypothetical protein SDC9_103958 [bioreactor metagenome]|uniref:Uncharacterized protein n=1 Tax=bioreactor metagenome TaxID=1076179 RepID=A0A645AVH6_9ZZZZ
MKVIGHDDDLIYVRFQCRDIPNTIAIFSGSTRIDIDTNADIGVFISQIPVKFAQKGTVTIAQTLVNFATVFNININA